MLKGYRILIDDVLRSRKIFRKDTGATVPGKVSANTGVRFQAPGQDCRFRSCHEINPKTKTRLISIKDKTSLYTGYIKSNILTNFDLLVKRQHNVFSASPNSKVE